VIANTSASPTHLSVPLTYQWCVRAVEEMIVRITWGDHPRSDEILQAARDQLGRSLFSVLAYFVPVLARLPLQAARRQANGRAVFQGVLLPLIREEMARPRFQQDSEAEDEQQLPSELRSERLSLIQLLIASNRLEDAVPLTEQELLSDAIAFLVGGNDSTGSALASVLYFLAQHPETQGRLREESRRIEIDPANPFAGLEQLQELSFFIKECLRLHPPFSGAFPRTALMDLEVGGYHVPKGTSLFVDFSAIHRDPQHWEDPHHFDHLRFSTEASATRFPHAFMPFSVGSRQCVAQRLSMVMLKVFASTLLRTHQVIAENSDEIEWVYQFGVCQPRDGELGVRVHLSA